MYTDKVTVEIHEPKDSPAVEPDPPARKPEGNDKLLKEAEEYLKKTQTKMLANIYCRCVHSYS